MVRRFGRRQLVVATRDQGGIGALAAFFMWGLAVLAMRDGVLSCH